MLSKYEQIIQKTKEENLYRTLKPQNNSYIDFSSNDYLCLSQHPDVIQAGCDAAKIYGAGSTGSRLLSGNQDIFEKFEAQIAKDKKTEAAIIFNSGFQANYSVLAALLTKNSLAIFDKLNHNSLYQGAFANRCRLLRYNHLDYQHLEYLLIHNSQYQHIFIVSETIFGMDGDCADVKILSFLAEKYGAFLYLDEAHATGVIGENGYGMSDGIILNDKTIIMGTFSKAIGVCGAYIACPQTIKTFLIQKCSGFIYSTALSPFCIGAAVKSWDIIKNMKKERLILQQNTTKLKISLLKSGCNLTCSKICQPTNIIAILFKDIDYMQKIYDKLLENNLLASFIRRPTCVISRLRLAINISHSSESLQKISNALSKAI